MSTRLTPPWPCPSMGAQNGRLGAGVAGPVHPIVAGHLRGQRTHPRSEYLHGMSDALVDFVSELVELVVRLPAAGS